MWSPPRMRRSSQIPASAPWARPAGCRSARPELARTLGVEPGSVDTVRRDQRRARRVTVVLDAAMMAHELARTFTRCRIPAPPPFLGRAWSHSWRPPDTRRGSSRSPRRRPLANRRIALRPGDSCDCNRLHASHLDHVRSIGLDHGLDVTLGRGLGSAPGHAFLKTASTFRHHALIGRTGITARLGSKEGVASRCCNKRKPPPAMV